MENLQFITSVNSDHEIDGMPSSARFVISEAFAREIIRLASLVSLNGLFKIEKFDRTANFHKDEPEDDEDSAVVEIDSDLVKTDSETLNVSATEFWFAAFLKHGDLEFNTDRQRIKDIALHFGISFDPNPNPTPEVKFPDALFVERVANLSIWDHDQDNGEPYDELDEPPGDGYLDSHTCLMNLIETARDIVKGEPA